MEERAWGEDDAATACIRVFTNLVDNKWKTLLSDDQCLTREERKAVRNVFRSYMFAMPKPPQGVGFKSGFPLHWILKKYRDQNSFYDKLTEYRNAYLLTKRQSLPDHYLDITTVGQAVLYFTFLALEADVERGTVPRAEDLREDSDRATVLGSMNAVCWQFMLKVATLCGEKMATHFFFGLPMYYYKCLTPEVIVAIYDGLKDMIDKSSVIANARAQMALLRYVKENCGERTVGDMSGARNKVKVTYMGMSWEFTRSVPEMVMDALCYSVTDSVSKEGDNVVRLYLGPNKAGRDALSYMDIKSNEEGRVSRLPTWVSLNNDCSAIMFMTSSGTRNEQDEYCARDRLILPEICGDMRLPPEGGKELNSGGKRDTESTGYEITPFPGASPPMVPGEDGSTGPTGPGGKPPKPAGPAGPVGPAGPTGPKPPAGGPSGPKPPAGPGKPPKPPGTGDRPKPGGPGGGGGGAGGPGSDPARPGGSDKPPVKPPKMPEVGNGAPVVPGEEEDKNPGGGGPGAGGPGAGGPGAGGRPGGDRPVVGEAPNQPGGQDPNNPQGGGAGRPGRDDDDYPKVNTPKEVREEIEKLEKSLAKYRAECAKRQARLARLEHHIETMRQLTVILSHKADIQTNRMPYAKVHPHSIDGSFPFPDWKPWLYGWTREQQWLRSTASA
ncbi:viral A type inclusion [Squirrelpox virus]|uniref:O1L n=1 Tax=Squirrelpox virus TaxID=240426 RepID=Q1HTS0_9POXV|nr:viral A type inclusion [Squirrelpox virus]ABD51466.1 O1L [Squirrelpox virus]CCD83298.1 viral A type inclusion [Squirrelpox virus]